jgi:hypothetical protein
MADRRGSPYVRTMLVTLHLLHEGKTALQRELPHVKVPTEARWRAREGILFGLFTALVPVLAGCFDPPGVHVARDQSVSFGPMMRRTSNEARPAARGPRSVSTGSKRLSSCAFIKRWCPPMRPVDDGSLARIGRRCDPGDQADDDGPEFVGP